MTDPRSYAQLASITAFAGRPEATEQFLNQAVQSAQQQVQLQSLSEGVQRAYSSPVAASVDHSVSAEQYLSRTPSGNAQAALGYKRAVDAAAKASYKPVPE